MCDRVDTWQNVTCDSSKHLFTCLNSHRCTLFVQSDSSSTSEVRRTGTHARMLQSLPPLYSSYREQGYQKGDVIVLQLQRKKKKKTEALMLPQHIQTSINQHNQKSKLINSLMSIRLSGELMGQATFHGIMGGTSCWTSAFLYVNTPDARYSELTVYWEGSFRVLNRNPNSNPLLTHCQCGRPHKSALGQRTEQTAQLDRCIEFLGYM